MTWYSWMFCVYSLWATHLAGCNVNATWTPITLYYLGDKNKGGKACIQMRSFQILLCMQNSERQTLGSVDPSVKWVISSIPVTEYGRKWAEGDRSGVFGLEQSQLFWRRCMSLTLLPYHHHHHQMPSVWPPSLFWHIYIWEDLSLYQCLTALWKGKCFVSQSSQVVGLSCVFLWEGGSCVCVSFSGLWTTALYS